jgi:molybdenum ABC transporter molybdate-binding protein
MRFSLAAVVFGSLLALAGLIALLAWEEQPSPGPSGQLLLVYCAAGIQPPVDDVLVEYGSAYGVKFQTTYAGSEELLGIIKAGEGDLFIAADIRYLLDGRRQGTIREIIPIARQRPVLVVLRGNPKKVSGLPDLLREEVKVSLANPEIAAISKVARKQLQPLGLWEPLWNKRTIERSTVNAVANDVKLQTADAGIVWDATVIHYPELQIVSAPEIESAVSQVCVGVLSASRQPNRALHFARYLTAPGKGLRHFQKHKYLVEPGDPWAERPELRLFSGGLNRPAIEEAIARFQQREGVDIVTTYAGCGSLVGQMKAGEHPDVYFACDTTFMDPVRGRELDLFLEPVVVSSTELVVIVPKQNPHGIARLEDLAQPGLKLALGDSELSALGALTDRVLAQRGLKDLVRANAQFTAPTADLCVAAVVEGRLDAGIVYRANTALQRDRLLVLPIDGPLARAIQPIAIGRQAKYPRLAQRLMDAITAGENKERFTGLGFQWLGE